MVLMAYTQNITSISFWGLLTKYHENPQMLLDRLFKLFNGSTQKQCEHEVTALRSNAFKTNLSELS